MKTEFEIKAQLDDRQLQRLLSESTPRGSARLCDVYFDTPDRRLFRNGAFLRIRNNAIVEIKYNSDDQDIAHVQCSEEVYDLPLSPANWSELVRQLRTWNVADNAQFTPDTQASANLANLGLEELVTVEKQRTEYAYSHAEWIVCVDEVKNLGTFVELEAATADASVEAARYCAEHGIVNVPIGYVELILRKIDRALYLQGRYLLPEDTITHE